MKGLLIKDLYLVRSALAFNFLVVAFLGVIFSILYSPYVIISMSVVMITAQAGITISYDKSSKWNMFSASLPVKKSTLLHSKYVLTVILSLVSLIFALIIMIIVSLFTSDLDPTYTVLYALTGIVLGLLPSSVNIPTGMILDNTKQVVVTLVSYAFTTVVLLSTIYITSLFTDVKEAFVPLSVSLFLVSVTVFAISWIISPKILAKKDIL